MALALLGVILLVDVIAPPEVDFSAFYLVPVIWLAWCRGTREGLFMALFCGVGWYLHALLSGRYASSEWYRLWDALNKQISYLLAAWAVGALRREVLAQQSLNQKLQASMAEVRELKGLLPVCAWCHKIRDDQGQWHSMEVFLLQRTGAAATHGICPSCLEKAEPELGSLRSTD
ncbi:MAG: hypothetical protein HXX12_06990 [Geothrix sp.]|uniref:hypothetical protein n=1 Tax=Geothrix sp. TaxID=1962974 RepID=UPI001803AF7B|nr:hypothetical protein [Geothrix sp.]NWJ40700.1 hypothetical protein [Geothrix sp.]WIL21293.1 MAG: hypothetical protein QOZ81_000547 [Geothrix sp.]